MNPSMDIFDSALNLEESHLKEGFDEGFREGVAAGEAEGREVGLRSGFELGEELGFYSGCISIWLALAASRGGGAHISDRARRSIKQLQFLLAGFPTSNPEDESLQDRLEDIRSKFRATASLIGVKLSFPSGESGSGGAEHSF